MKIISFCIPCILLGCVTGGVTYVNEITRKPPAQWTEDDCMMIITHATGHNGGDTETRVKVYATPFTPNVLTAMKKINRLPALLENNVLETAGIVYDEGHGAFRRTEDTLSDIPAGRSTLLLLVSLENKTWPYATVDISDIEGKIFLENDREERISPVYVIGKKQPVLAQEENLILMFQLRQKTTHFLAGSEQFHLTVTGFENIIKLHFPVSVLE